jgi:hypothetical protein
VFLGIVCRVGSVTCSCCGSVSGIWIIFIGVILRVGVLVGRQGSRGGSCGGRAVLSVVGFGGCLLDRFRPIRILWTPG